MARFFDYWPLITYVTFSALYVFGILYVLLVAPYIAVETFEALRAFASWCGDTVANIKASVQYILSKSGG